MLVVEALFIIQVYLGKLLLLGMLAMSQYVYNVQWGYKNTNPITFPITYSKTVFNVVPQLQALNDSANMSKNRVAITNLTTSGFSLQNPQNVYNWIAVGI